VEGGWDIDESVRLSALLKEAGADVIDCSSGGNSPLQVIKDAPGYQVPFAEKIRKEVDIPTQAIGQIFDFDQAEEILKSGKADFVALAREFLREPQWPLKAGKFFAEENLH